MKYFGLAAVALAFAVSQLLIGGTRLLYSLPAYTLLALVALCAILPQWRQTKTLPVGCLLTTAVFFIYIVVRDRLSPIDYLSRPDLFIVVGGLMVYLLTALFFVRGRDRMFLFYALLALALLHLGVAAIQFKEGNQYMPFPWIKRTDTSWRASGFYISPNHFSGLIEALALMAVSVTIWSRRRGIVKAFVAYLGLGCVIGVAISGSRGGYLSLMFGFLVLAGLSWWAGRTLFREHGSRVGVTVAAAVFLVFGSVGALLAQSQTIKTRFAAINDPENMRFLLWGSALRQFGLEPLWGTGAGTFLYHGRTFRNPAVQNDPVFVHNDYLHLLAEYGTIGAGAFLLFFGWHVATGFRAMRILIHETGEQRETKSDALALQIGAMSAIAAYVIHSAVDFNLHIPANVLVMAFLFGIVANSGRIPVAGSRWHIRAGAVTRGVLFLLAVITLTYGLPLLRGEWYAEWARQALRDYRLAEARSLASEALKYEQANPDIYYYAGEAAREMAAQKLGPVDELNGEAVLMFKKGLEIFRDDSRTTIKLAQAYDQQRRFEEADEELTRALEIDPNSTFVHTYYGMHYQAQGMMQEAESEYQVALELEGFDQNKMARAGLAQIAEILNPTRAKPRPGAAVPPNEPAPAAEEEKDEADPADGASQTR